MSAESVRELKALGSSMRKSDTMHEDGASLTGDGHKLSQMAVPQALQEWGAKVLSPMDKDGTAQIVMAGHRVKVRKLGPDLYSGWTERGDEIRHKFSRVTMPELMGQLQSQLEMYGREAKEAVGAAADLVPGGTHITDKPIPETSSEAGPDQMRPEVKPSDEDEADRAAMVGEKLEALRAKVKGEVIPARDLQDGLDNPERECPACEERSEDCSCYEGLSQPRVEIDLKAKKIVVMFKSDWNSEDKDSFKEDLKRRAGVVLAKRDALDKARQVVDFAARRKLR